MPLRDLLTALEEQEAAEHDQAQQTRRQQAEQIIARARDRAAMVRADTLTRAETEARQEAQSLLIAARAGARRASRAARDDALEEVHTKVRRQLLDLPGSPGGAAVAGACVDEALAALPGAATVRVHPADAGTLASAVSVNVVADLATGGAIAEDREGRYVDNTYLTRLENIWPNARVRLNRTWDRA